MLWEGSDDGFTSLDASDRGLNEDDSRWLVAVDYDNDGDREVITNNYLGNVTVYDNVGSTGNSLQFRVANDHGTTAIGAVIRVEKADKSAVVHHTDRTDFLAQGSLVSHVGVGESESVAIHVLWPDGTEYTFENVSTNQRVRITKDGIKSVVTFYLDGT